MRAEKGSDVEEARQLSASAEVEVEASAAKVDDQD
jgi:hypothetical protein